GIRDRTVTGVQTCALPISPLPERGIAAEALDALPDLAQFSRVQNGRFFGYVLGSGEPVGAVADLFVSVLNQNVTAWRSGPAAVRSEERRVGKECGARWGGG